VPRRPLGRAFVVAAIVLGVFAFAQLVAVSLYCVPLWLPSLAKLHHPALVDGVPQYSQPPAQSFEPYRPSRDVAPEQAAIERTQILQQMDIASEEVSEQIVPTPTPVPIPPEDPTVALRMEQATRLANEADEKYSVGYYDEALALLRKAEELLPNDANIQYRIALVYGALGDAIEAYRSYERALAMPGLPPSLKRKSEQQMQLISQNLPDTDMHNKRVSAGEFGEGTRDEDGLRPGSDMGIISAKWQPDDDTAKKTLRVAIKTRPSTEMDPQEVTVVAYVYEKDASGAPVVVASEEKRVNTKWLSPSPSWINNEPELLDIEYTALSESSKNKLYGYTIAIYYDHLLQDVTASPETLLQQDPPKLSLEEE